MTGSLTKTFRRRLRRTPAEERAVEALPADGRATRPPRSTSRPTTRCSPTCRARAARSTSRRSSSTRPRSRELKAAGVKLAVPLVSQGELIGVLNLGPRLSEQEYSSDDRKLLDNLAAQAAPALRVGQLVREQEAEAATRQRFEQELEVARLIQQNFLPKELPELPGWQVAAYYRPAREVGGDFYDVIPLPDGRGRLRGRRRDRQGRARRARDGGHPQRAARLRPAARSSPARCSSASTSTSAPTCRRRCSSPASTACSTPRAGRLRFANAGHDLPYVKTADGVVELRARGMPLGLMPGMAYEEKETVLAARRQRAAALRRHRRGARPRPRDVRLPAPQADAWPTRPAAAS